MSATPIFKQLQRVRIFGEVSKAEYIISHINKDDGDVVLLNSAGHFRPSKIRYLVHVEDTVEAVEPVSDQIEYPEIEFLDIMVGDLIEVRQTLGERSMVTRDRITKIHNDFAVLGTANLAVVGKDKLPIGVGLEGLTQTIVLIDRPKVLPTIVGSIISLERPTNYDKSWSYYTSAVLLPASETRPNDHWVVTSDSGSVSTRTPYFFKNLDWTLIREGW